LNCTEADAGDRHVARAMLRPCLDKTEISIRSFASNIRPSPLERPIADRVSLIAPVTSSLWEAYSSATGNRVSQTAFGSAMAAIGYPKEKRGGKVYYVGVAFQPMRKLVSST
jgi:hypothetical protein